MTNNGDIEDIKQRLDDNEAGALSYSLGFITGIIFYYLYENNDYVRFHASQSMTVFGVIVGVSFILNITILSFSVVPLFGEFIGLILGTAQQVLGIAAFALWIFLMFKAYQGERYGLPIVKDVIRNANLI